MSLLPFKKHFENDLNEKSFFKDETNVKPSSTCQLIAMRRLHQNSALVVDCANTKKHHNQKYEFYIQCGSSLDQNINTYTAELKQVKDEIQYSHNGECCMSNV